MPAVTWLDVVKTQLAANPGKSVKDVVPEARKEWNLINMQESLTAAGDYGPRGFLGFPAVFRSFCDAPVGSSASNFLQTCSDGIFLVGDLYIRVMKC